MLQQSPPPLQVGIVGAGSWARQAHVPGFQSCPGVEVVAICDLDVERARSVAAEAGIPGAYPTAAAMLAEKRLDLISVVTPDDAHRADVELALEAGAHVLCEKPLATTLTDARALTDLARVSDRQTKVGFAMRYASALRYLRELVAAGALGTPRLFQAFQQNGQFLDPATPFHWKMDRARTGGGAIVEYGIHTIDLARWLMGEVAAVSATARTWIAERPLPGDAGPAPVEVDDSTAWLMEFRGGALGLCHAGWATPGRPPGLEVRIFGSAGAGRCLLSDDLSGAQGLWLAGPDGHFRPTEIPPHFSNEMPADGPWWYRFPAHLIRQFVAEIRANAPAGPSFADGLAAQAILDAVISATNERRWATVTHHPSPVTPSPTHTAGHRRSPRLKAACRSRRRHRHSRPRR